MNNLHLSALILNKINTGIIVIDEQQKIVSWNHWLENYSGISAQEALYRHVPEILPILQKPYYQHLFKNAIENGQSMFCSGAIHSVFIPIKHKKNNGDSIVKQNMLIEPIDFEQQTYILIQINDITNQYKQVQLLKEEIKERKRVEEIIRKSELEMKRLRDKAIEASNAKTDFVATMSHEIRTPMNAIIGMAELLQDTELTEEQLEYVKIFNHAGENLLRIINDILDFSKIESGKMEKEDVEIMLPEFLEDIVSMYSFQAYKKNVKFSYKAKTDIPAFAYGDPTRLRQILTNILANAIKFTHTGEIIMEVRHKQVADNQIELQCRIQDTGIGIPKHKLQAIFEPFSQVDSSTSRTYGGTGLGLTIVKNLLEMMNGTIEVDSDLGDGTVFTFTVVLKVNPGSMSKDIPELKITGQQEDSNWQNVKINGMTSSNLEKIGKVNEHKKRILVAEDTPDNYKLIQLYLKDEDFIIDIAENGLIAVELFKKNNYHLIIMDIEMPELDGLEATQQIRQWEQEEGLMETPILAVTAHAILKYRVKSIEVGCNHYLAKPIKKKEFIDTVRELLT
ncbi:ATP-binding protein [Desulfuribacillus alkaliarsenatis]|nr:ATP-binding protein [Desulfuribacillus alkaliarsenatis]